MTKEKKYGHNGMRQEEPKNQKPMMDRESKEAGYKSEYGEKKAHKSGNAAGYYSERDEKRHERPVKDERSRGSYEDEEGNGRSKNL